MSQQRTDVFMVDPALLEKRFAGTPRAASPEIIALAHYLSPKHEPIFVSIEPEPTAERAECFFNVQAKIKRDGGQIIYGWAIWEWPRVFLEAEHHAVWSDGSHLVDITPNDPGIRQTLFLPDPTHVYDYTTKTRIINVKRPLSTMSAILSWIDATNRFQEHLESNSEGRLIRLSPAAQSSTHTLWREALSAKAEILAWLAQMTGRNQPCFCQSGRKFKKCCADLVRPVKASDWT